NKNKNPAFNRATNSTGSVSSPRSVKDLYREKEHSFRVFTLHELRDATNGFNRMLKIGEGGFGSVYKGSILPPNGQGDPILVAIKRLNTRGFQVYIMLDFVTVSCFHDFALMYFNTSV
ncbi:putative receptor-like protein kinase, partial [Trifolium medium]|nr:putative receptor-like protein kinase [Trifolium medium]